MTTRTRFALSPNGPLDLGAALSAVLSRRRGDRLLLCIDDADPAREVEGAEAAVVDDLRWLGIGWDEGPVRRSERIERHREAAHAIGREDADGALRFGGLTLLDADGFPAGELAGVVDDHDFGVTHVVSGADRREAGERERELARALGFEPPQYVHHGLLVGEDGGKLSRRESPLATVAGLRAAGIPATAARRYLDELGDRLADSAHDARLDLRRLRRLAIDAIATMPDVELAAAAGAPPAVVPALRGARDLNEARGIARTLLEPSPVTLSEAARPTLERFAALRAGGLDPRAIVRELQAVGGDLEALRLALTGAARGPALRAVIAALPRDESLRRVDAAL